MKSAKKPVTKLTVTKPIFCILALLLMWVNSSCVKTRAQLNEERDSQEGMNSATENGSYALDEIKTELSKQSGRIEDLERLRKDEKHSDKIKETERRIEELEQSQAQMIQVIQKLQKSAESAASVGSHLSESEDTSSDPTALLESGKMHLAAGEFNKAVKVFSQYIDTVKSNKNKDEAYYFRGESLYRLKEYKKAILDFSKISEKFAKSKRTTEALYKIGLSFEALGMKEDAKGFYQEILDKYPKSKEATKAKAKLKK